MELQMTCFSWPQIMLRHSIYQLASAVIFQLSSAAINQLRSAAFCNLSCNKLAHMQFVSSAANCQLSCTLLVQIRLSSQLNMLLELSAFSSFVTYLPGCTLSAPISFISLTVLDKIDCSVSTWLWCQLRCNLSAQLPLAHFFVSLTVSSAPYIIFSPTRHVSCSLSARLHLVAQV